MLDLFSLFRLFKPSGNMEEIPTDAEDPLPDQNKDGEYWSGWRSGRDPNLPYAEGRKEIADLILERTEKYPVRIITSKEWVFDNAEIYRRYIENVACVGLIPGTGDHYIRYHIVKFAKTYDKFEGVFLVRCGDCGKIAAGYFIGNPDMGDPAYQILHRKDYFCSKFGWTFMGGHGYPGGRRMICPKCSKEYEKRNRE